MQLTRYTDYGLRILIYLALKPEGELSSIDEISNVYAISRNNVNKIVHHLGKVQLLKTKRGKGGGFSLHAAPKEINIGDVVQELEGKLDVVECVKPPCRILPACQLKHVLQEATQAFVQVLNQYTLADLIDHHQSELISILNITDTGNHG